MHVCPPGDNVVATISESLGQRTSIAHHLQLVLFEFGRASLIEGVGQIYEGVGQIDEGAGY